MGNSRSKGVAVGKELSDCYEQCRLKTAQEMKPVSSEPESKPTKEPFTVSYTLSTPELVFVGTLLLAYVYLKR